MAFVAFFSENFDATQSSWILSCSRCGTVVPRATVSRRNTHQEITANALEFDIRYPNAKSKKSVSVSFFSVAQTSKYRHQMDWLSPLLWSESNRRYDFTVDWIKIEIYMRLIHWSQITHSILKLELARAVNALRNRMKKLIYWRIKQTYRWKEFNLIYRR